MTEQVISNLDVAKQMITLARVENTVTILLISACLVIGGICCKKSVENDKIDDFLVGNDSGFFLRRRS